MMDTKNTTNIVIAALGGEGGGTLVSWIEAVAIAAGWHAQVTSIAGVAQRTGATIYYIELFPGKTESDRVPIMSSFPAPGDIDIAISSEIAEAGRLIQRGFCSKDRTTLIASSHHVYGITEKMVLSDGAINSVEIARVAEQQCKRLVSFDMQELAVKNNTVISATLLGALAGSKALPFDRSAFQEVIKSGGKMIENNLAAFDASYNKAIAPALVVEKGAEKVLPAANKTQANYAEAFQLPTANTQNGTRLLTQIEGQFPTACHEYLYLGVKKLNDYQDFEYAQQYIDELKLVLALDNADSGYQLTRETARHLALWMGYEDTARVAQLKTQQLRQAKIRDEVKADAGQIVHVTEYFAPRLEELCQPLPGGLARAILGSELCRKLAKPLTKGKRFRTDTILSFSMMRMMAASRRWRRISFSYAEEHERINAWLEQIKSYAVDDLAAATEIAKCARIVKGYGKTRERGSQQIEDIIGTLKNQRRNSIEIQALKKAALADDDNTEFKQALSDLATA